MDRRAWETTVHRVTKSRTRLKQLTMHLLEYNLHKGRNLFLLYLWYISQVPWTGHGPFFSLSLFWPCLLACRTLIPWPGIEPRPKAVKALHPNNWTVRKSPDMVHFLNKCLMNGWMNEYNILIKVFLFLVLVAQSCPTLWDFRDCGPQGSSVHGILQARILQWVAIPFSRGSSHHPSIIETFLEVI